MGLCRGPVFRDLSSLGEFFLSSSPSLLGFTLDTVFYPLHSHSPPGDRPVPVHMLGRGGLLCKPLSLFFLQQDRVLPLLSDLLPPKGVLALGRGLSGQMWARAEPVEGVESITGHTSVF